MKNSHKKVLTTIAAILLLSISTMLAVLPAEAQTKVPDRATTAYLSCNPHLLGLTQPLTVNLWIYPSAAGPNYEAGSTLALQSFENITMTMTKPDGTKETFMPVDGTGAFPPGTTESIGAIYFIYYPNQIGEWKMQFTFPGKTFTIKNYSVTYLPSTSQVVSFTVQKDLVRIGLDPVPLPTDYWTHPINAQNREWYQVSGEWLQSNFGSFTDNYNPYSDAPGSAHIAWYTQAAAGGIIGGEWGSLSYGGTVPTPIIMMGRVYYNVPNTQFTSVDLNTGKVFWTMPGSISLGWHASGNTVVNNVPATGSPVPYLWGVTSTAWTLYDAYSGVATRTITNVPGSLTTKWTDASEIVYCLRQGTWSVETQRRPYNELLMWNLTKVTNNNWMTGIVWNVSLKQPDGTGSGEGGRGSGIILSDDYSVLCVHSVGEDLYYGYNMNTGAMVYKKSCGFPEMNAGYWSAHGTLTFAWNSQTMKVTAIDVKTGNIKWTSDVIGNYPWGSNTAVYQADMTNLYILSFDGSCYAVDLATGKLKWTFFVGSTTETVFGNWAPRLYVRIADGKGYFFTSEHTPTQPRIRGNKLFCIDLQTGKGIWNLTSAIAPSAVSSGYVLGGNEDDGCLYCIGKGPSATSVTVQTDVIGKGATALIKGTVLDQSPAQPGTPAVSDESMGPWMDYLHMQKPMPTNVKGVPVLLTATGPDGSNINIGTVTSDGYGNFGYLWTPPSTGLYKIQATFAGSESYGSSSAETLLGVVTLTASPSATASTPTQTATPSQPSQETAPSQPAQTSAVSTATPSASASPSIAPPPSTESAPSMTLYIAFAASGIIVAAAAAALLLKRRSK